MLRSRLSTSLTLGNTLKRLSEDRELKGGSGDDERGERQCEN